MHGFKSSAPGGNLSIDIVSRADLAIATYQYARPDDVLGSECRAGSAGFGLSYGLPPIAALLASTRDSAGGVVLLVIVENPEFHLHPARQIALAKLAARAVGGGAQVILETHSDHVLDGVRLAVLNQVLSPSNVTIHYFKRNGINATITTPEISSDGRLDI